MAETNINSEVNDDQRLLKRRGQISAYGRSRRSFRQLLIVLLCCFAVLGGLIVYGLVRSANGQGVSGVLVSVGVGIICFGLYCALYAKRNFVEPDQALRKWLQCVCDGDTDARVDLAESNPHFPEINFHTRNLGSALTRLSSEMDDLVELQTHRLSEQNRSLDVLCRLTADVANVSNEPEVFVTVCRSLADWYDDAKVHAFIAVENEPKLLLTRSSISGRDNMKSAEDFVESGDSAGDDNVAALVYGDRGVELVAAITQDTNSNSRYRFRTSIPFFDAGVPAGVIVIDSTEQYPAGEVETQRVLKSTSEQLTLFYAQKRAIEESQTMQAVRERADLAADIHDSLAQTLAALRYQFSMVEESLNVTSDDRLLTQLRPEIARIRATIAEANDEARGLIGEYRKPLEGRCFADALRDTVDRYRNKTNSEIFLQIEDREIVFNQREESQLLKIVGESLNNAIKYSEARLIRVVLSSGREGARRVVVEDDGIGFAHVDTSTEDHGSLAGDRAGNTAGDHIGLSIMHERAESIDADLNIETEPGEGTRVFVQLRSASPAVNAS